jgi:hypothetical protein
MHNAFGIVIWIVCGIGLVVALVALIGNGKAWEEFGKQGLLMERDLASSSNGWGAAIRPAGSRGAVADAERDEEIRQMLQARNARRARRGEAPIDIEAELQRLVRPAIDDELRGEIREMVVARNHRRVRRGKPPLDVEAEVEREIEKLTQLD